MKPTTFYLPTEEETDKFFIEKRELIQTTFTVPNPEKQFADFKVNLTPCFGYTFTEEELKLFLKKYVAFDYDGDYDDENGVIDEFLQTLKEK